MKLLKLVEERGKIRITKVEKAIWNIIDLKRLKYCSTEDRIDSITQNEKG